MVKKYPDLERGERTGKTGRDHVPPRVFQEMTRLTKQKAKKDIHEHNIESIEAA